MRGERDGSHAPDVGCVGTLSCVVFVCGVEDSLESPDQRASREVPVAGLAFTDRLGSGSEPPARVLKGGRRREDHGTKEK
jgi:hypothetical protein